MVFKRLLGSLGVGAPTIDTVLEPAPVVPGGALGGQVHLKGGQADFDIEHITLDLVARVEAEHAEGESEGTVVFDRFTVGGGFRLAAGESRSVPFGVTLPWETPVTELYGQPLGIVLGVRTEVAVAGAKDQGDLDPLTVTPLPAQEAILEAFGQLGFGFKSADLEYGHIGGTGQLLPFYQEIELHPAPQYAHQVNEVELTFLAGPGDWRWSWRPTSAAASSPPAMTRSPVSPSATTTPATGPRRSTAGSAGSWRTGRRTGHHPRTGTPPRTRTTSTTVPASTVTTRNTTAPAPAWARPSRPARPGWRSVSSAGWSPPKSSTRWGTSSRATRTRAERYGP